MDRIVKDSEAIKALKHRVIMLVKDKKFNEAITVLNEIISIDPRNFQSIFQLAQIFFAQKKPELSVKGIEIPY